MARAENTLPPAGERQAIDHSPGTAKFANRPSALEVMPIAPKAPGLIHNRSPREIAESPMEGVVSLVSGTLEPSALSRL